MFFSGGCAPAAGDHAAVERGAAASVARPQPLALTSPASDAGGGGGRVNLLAGIGGVNLASTGNDLGERIMNFSILVRY